MTVKWQTRTQGLEVRVKVGRTVFLLSDIDGEAWILEAFDHATKTAYRRPGHVSLEEGKQLATDAARDFACVRWERQPIVDRDDLAYWRAK